MECPRKTHFNTQWGGGGGYLPSSTQIHRPWVERQGLVGPEMSSKANNILTREIAAGFSPQGWLVGSQCGLHGGGGDSGGAVGARCGHCVARRRRRSSVLQLISAQEVTLPRPKPDPNHTYLPNGKSNLIECHGNDQIFKGSHSICKLFLLNVFCKFVLFFLVKQNIKVFDAGNSVHQKILVKILTRNRVWTKSLQRSPAVRGL